MAAGEFKSVAEAECAARTFKAVDDIKQLDRLYRRSSPEQWAEIGRRTGAPVTILLLARPPSSTDEPAGDTAAGP
jgi:hypothetical protein